MKSGVTLATVTTEFLERPGLAPSTRETYELTLGLLLQNYGSWSIGIISKQTLVEYLNNLSHLKYTTHQKHQAILQSLLNFAVEQGYIKSNPIRGLKQRLPEREKGEHKSDSAIRYLTQSQLNILYAAVENDLRLSAIVHLLHRTGCRIGEILALNIDSVDINKQKFQVLGKGNKERWCYYSDDAAKVLAKYLKYSRHQNTNALFTAQHPVTLKVSRISYHTLHDYWREITNKYPQLQLCRIHDLRHTFATERVGLISIEELCSLMGHESIQTTLRYAKVTSQKSESAARHASRDLRRHPEPIRYTLFTAFCWLRSQEVIDNLVELLIQIVHRIGANAEKRVDKELIQDFKRVHGKNNLLYQMAEASLKTPDGTIKDVIFPVVSEVTLKNLVKEYKSTGNAYREKVYTVMRSSYGGYYRRILPLILNKLEFRSNNEVHRPVIQAISILKKYADSKQRYYDAGEDIPIDGVLRSGWQEIILETEADDEIKVNRINYELSVLQALREKLRCKEIWVVGANRYRNPEEDLPADFEAQRLEYFQALKQPSDVEVFIANLQKQMDEALTLLSKGIPKNKLVTLKNTGKSRICVSPLNPQNEPANLTRLKSEITRRWRMTSLLDILKETDLRVNFSHHFRSVSSREVLGDYTLQKRLLLCLYGLGTNTGLKRLSDEIKGDNYQDLLHVKRHFIQKEQLRNAIACVANAIFTARIPTIWGEGTTACASDSKKFGAWDQNLMTEWHIRYGGRGVMIYWHVEKNSVCIYSQLKTCSSSEVAAMIEGLLRHCTQMKVETNYVDSHGQNEVAFAFCHLLGFQLMPRLKRINVQKLYRPSTGNNDAYPNLQPILTRAINWDLIRQQYDQMVKYATALRLGMAETEAILKRFTRGNLLHPTYQALSELGKAVKTIFLCKYLHSVELRQEINAGLNVVENWNSANSFIFYGKGGEIATNRLSDQELAVLSLHLLQISLVYINTLMIQEVLSQPQWMRLMKLEDLRALSPLIWGHVNPYGTFRLDLNVRLPIETG